MEPRIGQRLAQRVSQRLRKPHSSFAAALLTAIMLASGAGAAAAQELKIGYVNSEKILRESAPARAAEQKIRQEFAKRDRELIEMGNKLKAAERELIEMGNKFKSAVEALDKEAPVLPESERIKRQRDVAEMDREFQRRQREVAEMDREAQRRQRELREDFNQRRNDELQILLERAQRIVRQVAEQEKFDLIVQDAIHYSQRVDITEKVLRALNNGK
jgi:outer membrane protein